MTAKEFIKKYLYVTKDDVEDVHDSLGAVENILIEFAKMHVKDALDAASINAKVGIKCNNCSEYHDNEIEKDSILNAYPETLIT